MRADKILGRAIFELLSISHKDTKAQRKEKNLRAFVPW
jgi:hypothetical protein